MSFLKFLSYFKEKLSNPEPNLGFNSNSNSNSNYTPISSSNMEVGSHKNSAGNRNFEWIMEEEKEKEHYMDNLVSPSSKPIFIKIPDSMVYCSAFENVAGGVVKHKIRGGLNNRKLEAMFYKVYFFGMDNVFQHPVLDNFQMVGFLNTGVPFRPYCKSYRVDISDLRRLFHIPVNPVNQVNPYEYVNISMDLVEGYLKEIELVDFEDILHIDAGKFSYIQLFSHISIYLLNYVEFSPLKKYFDYNNLNKYRIYMFYPLNDVYKIILTDRNGVDIEIKDIG